MVEKLLNEILKLLENWTHLRKEMGRVNTQSLEATKCIDKDKFLPMVMLDTCIKELQSIIILFYINRDAEEKSQRT